MIRIIIITVGIFFNFTITAEERNANTDSKVISNYMKTHYSKMVEQYVEVFLGHLNCKYDFIDETIFNNIADNAIKDLVRVATEVISTNQQYQLNSNQKPLIDYLASVIALSVMDVHSSAESAQIRSKMEKGLITCENSMNKHKQMYKQLIKNK